MSNLFDIEIRKILTPEQLQIRKPIEIETIIRNYIVDKLLNNQKFFNRIFDIELNLNQINVENKINNTIEIELTRSLTTPNNLAKKIYEIELNSILNENTLDTVIPVGKKYEIELLKKSSQSEPIKNKIIDLELILNQLNNSLINSINKPKIYEIEITDNRANKLSNNYKNILDIEFIINKISNQIQKGNIYEIEVYKNKTSIDNTSIDNTSIDNTSIDNTSNDNTSVNNTPTDNLTVEKTYIITANNGKYYLDNQVNPMINLKKNKTYIFDLRDTSTNSHPFYITTGNLGGQNAIDNKYDNGVITNGNHNGTTTQTITFTVPDNSPNILYYHCGLHQNMGNTINIIDNKVINDNLILNSEEINIDHDQVNVRKEVNKIIADIDYKINNYTYHILINLKNNEWYNLSISTIYDHQTINSDLEKFTKFLLNFNIKQIYSNENGVHFNLLDSNTFSKVFDNYVDFRNIDTENYIPNSMPKTSDSCFLMKESKPIYALIIGITYKNNQFLILDGTSNDVNNMENMLNNYYGHENITISKMVDVSISENSEYYPTLENIQKQLSILVDKSKDHNIIFYFAGHTNKDTDRNNDEINDSQDECLLTSDLQYICDDWFYTNFTSKLDKDCECRIYLDTCFSGGFCDLPYIINNSKILENKNIMPEDNNLPKIIAIVSSKENQVSYEIGNTLNKTGKYTTKLIESITKLGNINIFNLPEVISLEDENQQIKVCSSYTFIQESLLLL